MILCPLCQSKEVKTVERLSTALISNLYKKNFGINAIQFFDKAKELEYVECQNCSLLYFSPLVEGDEEFYKKLNTYKWYYENEKDEYSYAQKYVHSGSNVLDVGCGEGAFSSYVKENGGNFLGLELNALAVDSGRSKGIDIRLSSIEKYASNTTLKYDMVASFQVCEHVGDLNSFIKSQISLVKKNGYLLIAVPSEEGFISFATNNILNMPPHHISRWRDSVFRYLETQFQLRLIDLHHEKISRKHLRWYYNLKIQNLFLESKLLDDRILRKFIGLFSSIFSYLILGFRIKPKSVGHTVIAVFQKL